MRLEFKSVSNDTEQAIIKWQALINLIRKSEAMISSALSRVKRADRLRMLYSKEKLDNPEIILAINAKFEGEAYTHLATLPGYLTFLKDELKKIIILIERGITNE